MVRDSTHDIVLQSASLAIYRAKDTSLVSYQLSNNLGEFHFREIPVNIPLIIKGYYVGYKQSTKKFMISGKTGRINLNEFNLNRTDNRLEDVVVKSLPPVQMNGDTLEFNADAFHLDSNAVVEDLFRYLPGVTVWGDGTITVNGKPVSRVLVEGKPFFGGDTRIASQNIAKSAVDKIQVYQQQKKLDNPLDSLTEVNIKLKKDKKFGSFGKISSGYGTHKRYESDGNVNFFNPKIQLGIVGASNNINKIANDVNTLMLNSTYKGVGASIDYHPDFRLQGVSQPNSGGAVFQYDFIPNPDYYRNNRLSGNYFLKNNTNTYDRKTKTIATLGEGNTQTRESKCIISLYWSTVLDFSGPLS